MHLGCLGGRPNDSSMQLHLLHYRKESKMSSEPSPGWVDKQGASVAHTIKLSSQSTLDATRYGLYQFTG